MAVKRSQIKSTKSKLRTAAKTNNKRIHIIFSTNGWMLKKEGAKRASKTFRTKDEAISGAKKIKNYNGAIIIHKRDGSIQRWAS